MIALQPVNILHIILVYHGFLLAGYIVWRLKFWALAGLIATFSVHMAFNFVVETGIWPGGDVIARTLSALYGPFFFLTVNGLIKGRFERPAWRDGLHLLPWLALLILAPPLVAVRMVSLVSLLVYLPWSFWRVWRFDKHVRHYRADAESVRLEWLYSVVLAFGAISLMDGARMILTGLGYNGAEALSYGLSITIAFICLNVIAYFSFQHIRRAGPDTKRHAFEALSGPEGLDTQEADGPSLELFERIEAVMRDEEPWREPGLRLEQLAKIVGKDAREVSRAINQHAGCSFVRYVNRARIAAIEATLVQGKSTTLMALAFDAGFNSKAAFNRAFKTETGFSPSEYLAHLRKNTENKSQNMK